MIFQLDDLTEERITIRKRQFSFHIYNENELTWKQHNLIHVALNTAYSYRTETFTSKTYGKISPIKRILCFYNNKIVGHTAVFETAIKVDNQLIKAGGIGMTLSLSPSII